MPNDDKRQKELTQEEIDVQNEKFRTFFSTGPTGVPDPASRRKDEKTDPLPQKGLLGKLFHRDKTENSAAPMDRPMEMPTGEILLTGSPDREEPQADLQLAYHSNEKLREFEDTAPEAPAKAEPAPKAPAVPKPEKPANTARPAVQKPAEPQRPRSPMEQKEDAEMQELKEMLFGKPKPAPKPAPPKAPEKPGLSGLVFAEEKPVAEPAKRPAPEKSKPVPPLTVAPAAPAKAEEVAKAPKAEKAAPELKATPAFRFFGKGDDEVTAPARETAPSVDDSMSLPLLSLDDEDAAPPMQAAPAQPAAPAPEAETPAAPAEEPAPAEAEAAPEEETGPITPEQVGEKLRHMGAALTLRCVLSGILALVLLHFGLVAEGLLAPVGVLDPVVAPAAFYAANLLFLAAAMAVALPVLRDGLQGLKKEGRPSADTMPALAACGALLEAVIALLNAQKYQVSSFTLLSGMAALGLFMALLGSRVMLASVKGGYDLAMSAPEHRGAYRVKNKDLIRTLARSLDEKDPWVLLSRPTEWDEKLVEQCFGVRASERRSRKTALILLGVSVLSGVVFLLFGGGVNGMAAALTAMLCMGAPLSSTLVAGVASLRLQKSAAAAGAVVPGWAAIEELGGVDTVQVDADDLFTTDSVLLEDIRIFKGGRIDRAILYAASILNDSCATLRGLFSQIIEDRTDILYPVKDLEFHRGLGFAGWCDNNRVLIGNRTYMEQEGIPLPEQEYEDQHSQNGTLQILYLAASGALHAMFVIRYVGGKNAARGLEALQKENIRLLVSCEDPSLTAKHITEAYHLPEGMVTLLDEEQCAELAAAQAPRPAAEDAEEAENTAPDTCCMLQSNGFASLTGGLRAAEQAQNAETTATTVQLVSVWFSVVIGVLLTYAGSLGTLSVAAVLMYQAAWSGLSLAVCALKQHN